MSHVREPAVAGRFYPGRPAELREMIERMLAETSGEPQPARGGVVPHAGLLYSGSCAARVFNQVSIPPVVVILAPNHTGRYENVGGAGAWDSGAFETPLGALSVDEDFVTRLEAACPLVAHDPAAHRWEHAVEVELPFLVMLAPESRIVPLVLAWDDWAKSRTLACALAGVVRESPDDVLLLASSDMTHYESAGRAAAKDRMALDAVERLDAEGLLAVCHRENVTMCGRAPAAVVLEATRQLGAERAEVVDYRHSGWVTGDDSSVVAYAGVVIR